MQVSFTASVRIQRLAQPAERRNASLRSPAGAAARARRCLAWCAAAAVWFVQPLSAATYTVPGDFPDLEAAINSASSGDRIVVAPGKYSGKGWVELDFRGKALHVTSAGGPETCVIDCGGTVRAAVFRSGEPPEAVLEGLTIRNGRVPYVGGALLITADAAPTIRNCRFVANQVFDPFCLGGCTTTGGAVALSGAGPVVFQDCLFFDNGAQLGGAVSIANGSATFRRCRFIANRAEPSVERSAGGALYAEAAELRFESCEFNANFADTISARAEGGALAFENVAALLVHCTFSANFATLDGDVLAAGDVSLIRIENSILWNAVRTPFAFDDSSTVLCRYSNVGLGWPGEGNIDAAPRFEAPLGPDGRIGTLDDDLRLRPDSPCIDTGDPAYQPGGTVRDLAGRLRRWSGGGAPEPRVDMGAHEHAAPGPGDLNCDGLVDFDDLAAFVLALTGPGPYALAYPACEHTLADANGDGAVDFDDISAFVRLLTGA